MVQLAARTKASYTYSKDWMMLRECVAGCLGSLQTISHQDVKVKLRLPIESPARFAKINGGLTEIKSVADHQEVIIDLGDLRFGDKRDILVRFTISGQPRIVSESLPKDAWENVVAKLEALGGSLDDELSDPDPTSEIPIVQGDVAFIDVLRGGFDAHSARPSLLTINMTSSNANTLSSGRPGTPSIPPHPVIVLRRTELLTSDMLSRALVLVANGHHERAYNLIRETREILKGLGKGSLPAVPRLSKTRAASKHSSPADSALSLDEFADSNTTQNDSPMSTDSLDTAGADGIDAVTLSALEAELEASMEWMKHPAVFTRDSRKALLQSIGVISSQRAFTFRTALESLWAAKISGTRSMAQKSRMWRETGSEVLTEEG
ncbi:hypothetical protein MRB53_038186 [Persea americana]|nr:hypothetical protein MRB53_038186 [Persea americana]